MVIQDLVDEFLGILRSPAVLAESESARLISCYCLEMFHIGGGS